MHCFCLDGHLKPSKAGLKADLSIRFCIFYTSLNMFHKHTCEQNVIYLSWQKVCLSSLCTSLPLSNWHGPTTLSLFESTQPQHSNQDEHQGSTQSLSFKYKYHWHSLQYTTFGWLKRTTILWSFFLTMVPSCTL